MVKKKDSCNYLDIPCSDCSLYNECAKTSCPGCGCKLETDPDGGYCNNCKTHWDIDVLKEKFEEDNPIWGDDLEGTFYEE